MCGICGFMNMGGAPAALPLVEAMMSMIEHRGPDGQGSHIHGEVGLGHRRLSIIDIEGGAQPMCNEDGSLWIVFNGEIYNFIELRKELVAYGRSFKTHSDTEVVIHAYEQWGEDCVQHFNGIFAFALWSQDERELFLARDHLGVKPLYYVRLGRQFVFASEIKALLVHPDCPREINLAALAELFTLRYVPSPDTLFRGIYKLPPAHTMRVSSEGIRTRPYWPSIPRIDNGTSSHDMVERYQSLLEQAVRLQMRSDVPVGLFLSSGVDSAALLALMSRLTDRPVKTFTIGFEEGERSNETADARMIANRFGADHSEMIIGARDYLDYYERYLWDLEEPVGNESAAAFYFVSLIASQSVKVALTGQGADEPWGGYPRYLGVKLSKTYSRIPRLFTDGAVRPFVNAFVKNEKFRRGVASLGDPNLLKRFVSIYSFYDSSMKKALFQPWLRHEIGVNGAQARRALRQLQETVSHLDPVSQMMYIDARANLPDDLLMVSDKTAMANSLEARVPFLDPRVVEFVETLPPRFKVRRFTGKYLHKKALEKWLPKEVVYRKKKGFANPVDLWLRGSLKAFIGDCLLSESSSLNQYFNRSYIEQLVREHESGQQDRLRHLYLLISLELWHRTFLRSSFSASSVSAQRVRA